jgi:hypothetical protein
MGWDLHLPPLSFGCCGRRGRALVPLFVERDLICICLWLFLYRNETSLPTRSFLTYKMCPYLPEISVSTFPYLPEVSLLEFFLPTRSFQKFPYLPEVSLLDLIEVLCVCVCVCVCVE